MFAAHRDRTVIWLVMLASLAAILPLILHGGSCGHDLPFHIESWIDAAIQLRHGVYPQWAGTAAWNAGEPRFVFYPPLSWLVGAALVLVFPVSAAPTIFIGIVLVAGGLTFYRFAREFVGKEAAILGAALYLANPYMLFCALERSAMAELMAAAWMPLLLLAVLQRRPTIRRVAVALALLWLTNAPAAVIGSYALAGLALARIAAAIVTRKTAADNASPVAPIVRLAATYVFGAVLGLALPAFYLVPAAYERRFVQIAMALVPELQPGNNLLFAHTADAAHDAVNHAVSIVAVAFLSLAAMSVLVLSLRRHNGARQRILMTPAEREARAAHLHLVHHPPLQRPDRPGYLLPLLVLVSVSVAVMLTPISLPLWKHLPELQFLQFPWRLLCLLAPVLAILLALLVDLTLPTLDDSFTRGRRYASGAAVILGLSLGMLGLHLYGQACDPEETPAALAHLLATHHGTLPTDEYTPQDADNDVLRTDDPAYWLIPSPSGKDADVNAPAPGTVPTAAELNPSIDTDDTPVAQAQTVSAAAPHTLTLTLQQPTILVLHLRAYPRWRVTDLDMAAYPSEIPRQDGLLALRLPAGRATLQLSWEGGNDATLGRTLSIVALLALAAPTAVRRRRRRRGSEVVPAVA